MPSGQLTRIFPQICISLIHDLTEHCRFNVEKLEHEHETVTLNDKSGIIIEACRHSFDNPSDKVS